MSVFRATGIRLSELAGIRYDPEDPLRSDVDLERREITVRGKGGRARIVRIGHETARSLAGQWRVQRAHRIPTAHPQVSAPPHETWRTVLHAGQPSWLTWIRRFASRCSTAAKDKGDSQ